MDNRRKENREKLTAFTPVYFLQPKILLGYLSDLTLHGGMVIGEKSVEINKQGPLAIEFPETLNDIILTHITIPASGCLVPTRCRQPQFAYHDWI